MRKTLKVLLLSQNSEISQLWCSESTSQKTHSSHITPKRRQHLMITAFQFCLSVSGETNRTRAGACQLVGYSLQAQHRKSSSLWWLLFTSRKEWKGCEEALRRSHLDWWEGLSRVTALGLMLKCCWFTKFSKAGNLSLFTEPIDPAELNLASELLPVTKQISILVSNVCLHWFETTASAFLIKKWFPLHLEVAWFVLRSMFLLYVWLPRVVIGELWLDLIKY